jgi:acyl dehydratase
MQESTRRRAFEGAEIGDELPTIEPDIRMETIRRFAQVAGMQNPRFTDHEGARKQGLPGAIVPGIMSQGILAALIHRWAPGSSVQRIDTVFRAPVLVDSRATARGVVTEVHPETGSVELDLVIENEAGEGRVLGTATVFAG